MPETGGPTYTHRNLTITATPQGGSPVVIATGAVDANGNLTARCQSHSGTTYEAVFAGDDWCLPATATILY